MPRKIKSEGRLYNQRVKELARDYMVIQPCKKCGSPVNSGYICMFCGDNNPSESK